MLKVLTINNKIATYKYKVASYELIYHAPDFTITLDKINADYTTITFDEYKSVTGNTWTFDGETTPVASITNDSSVTGITLQFTEPTQQDGNTTLINNDTQLQFDNGSHNNTYDVRLTVENQYLLDIDFDDTHSQGYNLYDYATGATISVYIQTGQFDWHYEPPIGNISHNEWIISSGSSYNNTVGPNVTMPPDLDPYTEYYQSTDIYTYDVIESSGDGYLSSFGDHNEPTLFNISQSGDTYFKMKTDLLLYQFIIDNTDTEIIDYNYNTGGVQGESGITETYKYYKYVWKDYFNHLYGFQISIDQTTQHTINTITPDTYVTYTVSGTSFTNDVYNVSMGNQYEIEIDYQAVPVGLGYGYLYNRYTTQNANFTPTDWDIPTYNDALDLQTFVGQTTGGGDLKEAGTTHWLTPNSGAVDTYNFSAVGSSARNWEGGWYNIITSQCEIFTSLANVFIQLNFDDSIMDIVGLYSGGGDENRWGGAVRLLYTGEGTPESTITDYEGNVYDIVLIGSQYWTAQNWKCNKMNNGDSITKITNNTTWGNASSSSDTYYCAFNNDEGNV